MNESFSARVSARDLESAAEQFEDVGNPGSVFVIVTIDDHGLLTIAPDPVQAVELQSVDR